MFAVINLLQGPSPLGFFDRAFHRIGNAIGIENRLATGVARGAANRLNQRGSGTQKAFFIGVENRNQRYFRQIQALAEQIDTDEHVKLAAAQVAQNPYALERFNI